MRIALVQETIDVTNDTSSREHQQRQSRREFIAASALAVGSAGVLAACQRGTRDDAGTPSGLPITVAGYKFSRVEALADGRVNIEGCDTTFEPGKIGDMNTDVFSGPQTYDVSEIGLHPFMLAYANDGFRDYSLLPIFPLRLFRHKSVFIRRDRGIERPEDLQGKTIATPGYSSSSLTWIRGIFQDEYGVTPEDVRWVVASQDSSAEDAGKVSAQESVLPEGVEITVGPPGKDESDLLESGEVDALFHAAEPRAYTQGHPDVARLFPDYRSVERAFFEKTGIFPIMHAVAIKNDVVDQNPWLVEAVFNAYSQAKQRAYEHMAQLGWLFDSLPWYGQELEETRALMGDNFYSYGIAPNRQTLEALFRYSHQQGLCSRELTIEEIFEPTSLDLAESLA